MKTIFIIITRGFIVRNILRSGVLSRLLQQPEIRVVLLFANVRGKTLPESIRKEFADPRITIEVLPPDMKEERTIKNRLYSRFSHYVAYLVFSPSTWMYLKSGTADQLGRHIFWAHVQRLIYAPLSKMKFLQRLVRWIELHIFYQGTYAGYFDQYAPDMVFSTSIVAKHDMEFMKEAKRRHIPTVSMCKGWDNITKFLLRVWPDQMIVQSPTMREDMQRVQGYPLERVHITGFPQFDSYLKKELLLPRDVFFQKLGLPADRELIFFGSEGVWCPDDHVVAETIARWVEANGLSKSCSMLVRPHFSDIHNPRFDGLKGRSLVKVDTNFTMSDFFLDNWNPDMQETAFFVNCIYHARMMIMTASTLALDAACLDKPTIAIGYGAVHHKNGEDVTWDFYKTDHYRTVVETGGILPVKSDEELRTAINDLLNGIDTTAPARERLREVLCYRVDGHSSERMAQILLKTLGV